MGNRVILIIEGEMDKSKSPNLLIRHFLVVLACHVLNSLAEEAR